MTQFTTYVGALSNLTTIGWENSPAGFSRVDSQTIGVTGDLSFAGTSVITTAAGDLSVSAVGNLLLPNLPTADPLVAGAVWNDTGTLKISAG